MSDVFSHMVHDLTKVKQIEPPTPISKQDFDEFLKHAIWGKLQGKTLGELFAERFSIHDRAFFVYTDDKLTLQHIRSCKYVKDF